MQIIKADGTTEDFDRAKLENSLKKSGADAQTTKKIADHIEKELQNGLTTSEIYNHAFELLAKLARHAVPTYSLRRAITAFGPEGYPFEKFVADIWRAKGYEAVTDQIVRGECVEHEVDVVAWKNKELIMMEAKFHNEPGLKCDLKTALYVKARTDDLEKSAFNFGEKGRSLTESILITNTKFTDKAVEYAVCAKNLRLIGWNYPEKGNLQDLIKETGLQPVTSLPSISQNNKKILFSNGAVLCRDLIAKKDELKNMGIQGDEAQKLVEDARMICG